MLFFWVNEVLRPLTHLGVWLFANTENEVLALDAGGGRHVDAYASDGSPFARLQPELHAGDDAAGVEEDLLQRLRTQQQRGARKREEKPPLSTTARDTFLRQRSTPHVAAQPAEDGAASLSAYLSTSTLISLLEYRLESSPLPLAVAAAGPRLRLAGELTAVCYFPSAAASVRPASVSSAALQAHAPPTTSHVAAARDASWHAADAQPTHHTSLPWLLTSSVAAPQYIRRLRGTSLQSLTRAMRFSAWWYARPAPASLCGGYSADGMRMGDGVEEKETHSTFLLSLSRHYCIPLSIEIVTPRGAPALPIPGGGSGASSAASLPRRVVGWLRETVAGVLRGGPASTAPRHPRLPQLDPELQHTAQQFVLLIDQLWCVRRCPLVELSMERYPLPLAEWLLSPDLHPTSSCGTENTASNHLITAASTSCSGGGGGAAESVVRARRAFAHVATLRCRGRVGQASVEAMSAATAGTQMSPAAALLARSASGLPFVGFTAVRGHLRVLDLSSTPIHTLEGLEAFPLLERVIVTGCAQLSSLSPLGLAPALRDIVASQSGIHDLDGLAQSRSLVSLSLYGCLNLTDVSACGRVPTLRDLFISESTVEVVEGLQASRSLVRLGMRYCDIPSLTALSAVTSLRVLHASCSTLASVAALQHCPLLEVVEVAACGQLVDLGPLGLAPSLVEVDATGSGVRHVDGLHCSTSLERLRLAQCGQLEDVGRLGQCVRLRQLSLSGTPISSLEGLAGAPALAWLDVSFCRQLASLGGLLRLPELRRVLVAGCTAALRRPDDVRCVVESLSTRRRRVEVVET